MDHIEEINSELTTFKGEQSILLRTKEGGRVVLTNQVLIAYDRHFRTYPVNKNTKKENKSPVCIVIDSLCNSNFLQDEIGLKEWLLSLRSAHKGSLELLANMARKAGKIYGTDLEANNRQLTHHNSPIASRSTNGT